MVSFSRFIISELLNKYRNHSKYYHSDLYRGLSLYRSSIDDKKRIFDVIKEVRSLYYYWGTFPDSYFKFGMFLKNYNDNDRIHSFVPQGAYYKYSNDYDSRYHILIDDKIIFHDIMSYYKLPVPTRFFVYREGEFRNGNLILTDAQVNQIISNITDERIFVKKFTGGAASGISIFTKGNDGKFYDDKQNLVTAQMLRDFCFNGGYIFEKQIIQDKVLKSFNPDTVNTIRVLTFNNKIISATVRFGGKGCFVDNISKGGVAVSVDIETGTLNDFGCRLYDLKKYFYHPDSRLRFNGTTIKQWPSIKEIVEKTCTYLPYYKSIGFDIATTDDGPVIIEINTGSGMYLSQLGKEYGLAKYFLTEKSNIINSTNNG